jgi:hypothetical protein
MHGEGQKKGFLHLIVPKSRFRLGEGVQDALSLYTFGTHTASSSLLPRLGCKVCKRTNERVNML